MLIESGIGNEEKVYRHSNGEYTVFGTTTSFTVSKFLDSLEESNGDNRYNYPIIEMNDEKKN